MALEESSRDQGAPPQQRLILASAFAVPVLLAAAVEDMITEAHECAQDAPGSILAMIIGFVLFTFVSRGVEDLASDWTEA